MSDIAELKQCPKCGGPIPAEAPQGLCPKCLLAQASIPTEAGKGAASRPVPPTQPELAAAFPQLEILGLIGQGGMGFVFKARQAKLERLVALKILPQSLAADPAFADRFIREGRLLARLNHPNIVTIHDFGQANGFFYLLMEYVDGVNLREAMRAGRFTPEQALAVVPRICDALQFAHNEGILHRDIKPENILLDTKGRIKIADFGIAKLVGEPHADAGLTATGGALGTPHYMAPEQIEKPATVDHRADIYSLGVVFYEMLTGELPLGKFQPPSQKVQVDVRLDEVVLHALEKEPARRYQQVSEVKTAVDTIANVPPSLEGVRAASARTQTPDRFWRRFAIACVLLVLAGILIPIVTILAAMVVPAWYRARASREAAQQAMQQMQAANAAAAKQSGVPRFANLFGPAIERTINDVETGTNYLLDLDTGLISTLPPSIKFEDNASTESWYRKAGIDVAGKSKGWQILSGCDLISEMVHEDRWENLTTEEMGRFLKRHRDGYAYPKSGLQNSFGNEYPTSLFKTREGNVGILQVTGASQNPPGVKIRYKLVKGPQNQTPGEAGASTQKQTSGGRRLTFAGAKAERNGVSVGTDSLLLPGESLLAWEKLDERIEEANTSLTIRCATNDVRTTCLLNYIFPESFGSEAAEEALAQLEQNITGHPILFMPGGRLQLFSVRNKSAEILVGYVEFKRSVLPPTGASAGSDVKIQATISNLHFRYTFPTNNALTVQYPNFGYSASVPPGCALRATANQGTASTFVSRYQNRTTWQTSWWRESQPPRPFDSPLAIREMPKQARLKQTELDAQLQRLTEGGTIQVALGEPALLFSVTNSSGEPFQAFFELVGTSAEASR